MFYYLLHWYSHHFLIYYKTNIKFSIVSSLTKKLVFLFNYFIPVGRIGVFVVGARSPGCFGGTLVCFGETPGIGCDGIFLVLSGCDLIEWLEGDRIKFACDSPTTESICPGRT